MPFFPDLTEPRYLDEVGWFLYHERYRRDEAGTSYEKERLRHSREFLDELMGFLDEEAEWLADKTVVSVGGGCTGHLATWPAQVKISVDPLLYAYQRLGMLIPDVPGTHPTIDLAMPAQDLPLMSGIADLVLCRNALDHMYEPEQALREVARILKSDGRLFVDVDLGGRPTPDEPTVFTPESLDSILSEHFRVIKRIDGNQPNSAHRDSSSRILLARQSCPEPVPVDRDQVLRDYEESIADSN